MQTAPARTRLLALLVVALGIWTAGRAAAETPQTVPADHAERMKRGLELFRLRVRPLLVAHCLECHGGQRTMADFDLSTRQTLLASGYVEATAADSYLMSLVRHIEEPHMPLKAPRLPEEAIADLGRWIDLGAPYDGPLVERPSDGRPAELKVTAASRRFWSFQRLAAVGPPGVGDAGWCRTEVDRFVLAALGERKLRPNPPADRARLIRRASFDLLGLPPAPEAVAAFVDDTDPAAYEKLIDRLLATPAYGERWARHWMDVARFAESHGYEQDYDRPHAYHYRDFLIRAFNEDMPYDQFVAWQLAGDELAPDEPLALMATGFLGAGAFPTQLTEAEFESARYDELDDMAATTGVAVLGLSVGCARCHDHKYDPIPARDYYRLVANFATTIRSEIPLCVPGGDEPVAVQVTSEGLAHMKHHADERGYPHFYEQTYHLARGDVHQKQEPAEPGFLEVLLDDGADASRWQTAAPQGWTRTSRRRAALAGWLTDVEQGAGHLAARVIVNRVWQHHFGRGIVATPNDFGLQGEAPTHPELLDWLAGDLVSHGWRLKRLHKLIMTSSVYMQSSDADDARLAIDPENLHLWRWTPRRLEAEAIRDAMLSVAGRLDGTMYGPGTLDELMPRRSVYFFIKRSSLIPTMMLFDWPEHLVSIGQRATTTTATQALAMMNSPLGRSCAAGLAERLEGLDAASAVERAFLLAYGRMPRDQERHAAAAFVQRQRQTYGEADHGRRERLALVDLCQAVLSMNEFIYVD